MKTLFVGQNSFHVESLDSTNSYASEMLRQIAPPDGTLIYTFDQKKGRGQRGNTWTGEPNKNVALSLILHPRFLPVGRQFMLTKATSLAVSDVMAELLGPGMGTISIKWPNDIYVNGKKVAGILIENTLREEGINHSVIGIGVNVNQISFTGVPHATSMQMLTGHEFRLMDVVERICEKMEAWYLQLRSGKEENLNSAYLQRLYRLNEWANYTTGDEAFPGKILGVTANGKLRLAQQNGSIREFDLKEISFK